MSQWAVDFAVVMAVIVLSIWGVAAISSKYGHKDD